MLREIKVVIKGIILKIYNTQFYIQASGKNKLINRHCCADNLPCSAPYSPPLASLLLHTMPLSDSFSLCAISPLLMVGAMFLEHFISGRKEMGGVISTADTTHSKLVWYQLHGGLASSPELCHLHTASVSCSYIALESLLL